MDRQLQIKAPAKINLYLKILGRRTDGFHDLISLMQKIQLYDELVISPQREGIHLHCPDSDLPENANNLVFKAAELFFVSQQERLVGKDRGVSLTLYKKIPVAAGLGGGSSDAAAVLLGLDRLFETNCSQAELISLAVQLGADVPFFVFGHPAAWATGIGEQLKPAVSLADYQLIIVNPGFSVATKWVFETFALTFGEKINSLYCSQKESDIFALKNAFKRQTIVPEEFENDLEAVTINKFPEINLLKNDLLQYGALNAMMSGSGPTVFGLFPEKSYLAVEKCFNELKEKYKNTYLVQALL